MDGQIIKRFNLNKIVTTSKKGEWELVLFVRTKENEKGINPIDAHYIVYPGQASPREWTDGNLHEWVQMNPLTDYMGKLREWPEIKRRMLDLDDVGSKEYVERSNVLVFTVVITCCATIMILSYCTYLFLR